MRARYSAYATADEAYLLDSWHPDTRPPGMTFPADMEWLGLAVGEVRRGDKLDADATVAFEARFRDSDGTFTLAENSIFERSNGVWVYRDALP